MVKLGPVAGGPRRHTVLIAIVLVFHAAQIKGWWIPKEDSLGYLSIASNFARGEFGHLGERNLHYAPGYPAMLTPLFWFAERPFLAISLFHFALLGLAFWGLWRWFRRVLPDGGDLLAATVLLHAAVAAHARLVLSETAFLAALVWTAELTRTAIRSGGWRWLGCALALLGTAAIRPAGIALCFAAAFCLWRARRRRGCGPIVTGFAIVALTLPAILFVAGFSLADAHWASRENSAAPDYLQLAGERAFWTPSQLLESLRLRISEVGRLVPPGTVKVYAPAQTWLHPATALSVVVFVAVGFGWWRRRLELAAEPLFVLLPPFFVLHCFWPFDQGVRFLLPALPILLLCAASYLPRRARPRRIALVVFLLLHAGVAVERWVSDWDARALHRRWPDVEAAAAHIGDQPETVAVLHNKDLRRMLELVLDRRTLHAGAVGEFPERATWLVIDPERSQPEGFEIALETEALLLLRRQDPGEPE